MPPHTHVVEQGHLTTPPQHIVNPEQHPSTSPFSIESPLTPTSHNHRPHVRAPCCATPGSYPTGSAKAQLKSAYRVWRSTAAVISGEAAGAPGEWIFSEAAVCVRREDLGW